MSDHVNEPNPDEARPFLEVLSGNPTDEEVAALVMVFSGLRAAKPDPAADVRSTWGRPVDAHRGRRVVSPAVESLRRTW